MRFKYLSRAALVLILALLAYFVLSGKALQARRCYLFYKGDGCIREKDFLAALGYYEKVLGMDPTDVKGRLRAAAALDSLGRPKEAEWHYKDARRYRSRKSIRREQEGQSKDTIQPHQVLHDSAMTGSPR